MGGRSGPGGGGAGQRARTQKKTQFRFTGQEPLSLYSFLAQSGQYTCSSWKTKRLLARFTEHFLQWKQ